MTDIPPRCISRSSGEKIVCEENRRKITFVNPHGKEVQKIAVDGCVFENETACDYLVLDWKNRECFVELKGKDVTRGLEQLKESIKKLSRSYQAKEGLWCFLITSESPLTTRVQLAQSRFKREFGATLRVRTRQCTVYLTENGASERIGNDGAKHSI
jgi:hypothetical protein